MKQIFSTGFVLGAVLATASLTVAQTASPDAMGGMKMGAMKMSQTIKIDAQNGSGEHGTATLTQSGDDLIVKLSLAGASGMQPDHIHKGTCDKLDPKPAYPLDTLSDGTSTTTLKGVKLSDLLAGTYAINVHKSTTDIKDYVACGNLTAAK
jgi:hypothetical protein